MNHWKDLVIAHQTTQSNRQKYDIQVQANELSDKDFDKFVNNVKWYTPKTINMGLNTSPGDKSWDSLVEQVRQTVESEEMASASWECNGRTRHQMHANQLREALPDYSFDIDYNYKCIIRKN